MSQPDAISFFFVLFLTSTILLSLLLRYGFSKSITFFNGLRFGLFWMFFITVLLVMNQAARETVDPERWSSERLFVPVVQENLPSPHQTIGNLLLGWLLFPMRTLPFAQVQIESIVTGIVFLLITGIVLEIAGRILVGSWQSRWTTVILFGFLLLHLMTYSAIGFIRQTAWLVIH
jgi:hypothetical protein